MAKGKYHEWLKADRLELIANWSAKGCNDKEIAHNIGISHDTYYSWLNRFPEFAEAVKRGRDFSVEAIENKLFEKAMGKCKVTETVTEFRGELRDGKPWNGTTVRREIVKEIPPDTGAIIFYLKNHAGYRDNPPEQVDTDVLKAARELLAGVPSAID